MDCREPFLPAKQSQNRSGVAGLAGCSVGRQISWPADTWDNTRRYFEGQGKGLNILLTLVEGTEKPPNGNRYPMLSATVSASS